MIKFISSWAAACKHWGSAPVGIGRFDVCIDLKQFLAERVGLTQELHIDGAIPRTHKAIFTQAIKETLDKPDFVPLNSVDVIPSRKLWHLAHRPSLGSGLSWPRSWGQDVQAVLRQLGGFRGPRRGHEVASTTRHEEISP